MYLAMYRYSCEKTSCAACVFQPFAVSSNQIIMWKDWLCIPAIYEQVNIGYLCGKFGCVSQPFNIKQRYIRYSCAKHIESWLCIPVIYSRVKSPLQTSHECDSLFIVALTSANLYPKNKKM